MLTDDSQGAERLDGGGSPGAWRVFYVHERCHAVARAGTGAGPRSTNCGGAPLAHIGASPSLPPGLSDDVCSR